MVITDALREYLAQGDILAFIDDDAIAAPGWLDGLSKVYVDQPEAAAVGGKIDLFWESVEPVWLHPDLHGYLGELDYGDKVMQIRNNYEKEVFNGDIGRIYILTPQERAQFVQKQ